MLLQSLFETYFISFYQIQIGFDCKKLCLIFLTLADIVTFLFLNYF